MKENDSNSMDAIYKHILANIHEVIYAVGTNGDLLSGSVQFMSEQVVDVVSYSPQEFIDNTGLWFSILHPDDVDELKKATLQMFETKKPVRRVYRIRHKTTGEYRWIEDKPSPQFDSKGNVAGYFGVAHDITEHVHTEQALRQSEEQYRDLFESTSDLIQVATTEGRLLYTNRAWQEILGYTPEEVPNLSVHQIVQPDSLAQCLATLSRAVSGEQVDRLETTFLTKEGKSVTVDGSIVCRYETGKPPTITCFLRDITERKIAELVSKQAEGALVASENRLRTIIETEPECVKTLDLDGNLLQMNPAGLAMIEADSLDAVAGQSIYPLVTPEYRDQFKELTEKVARGGSGTLEFQIVGLKGTRRWLETHAVPLRTANNEVVALLGITRDITERKQAAEALKQSEEKYKSFFDEDLTGAYISTPDGRLLDCNPAFIRIFGYASIEEALSTNARSFYLDPQVRQVLLRRLQEEKKLEYYEIEMARRDGTRVFVVANLIGKFNEQGDLTEIKGFLFDETKRRELEQQLIQAQKLEGIGTLASGIAHDFNNILGIIMGHSSLLEERQLKPAEFSQSVERIVTATQRGASLVRQILTFARKTEILFETVNVNNLVKEITRLLSETFPKTVEVVATLQKDLPSIAADVTQIHQILLNLCVNARDAMPQGGRLTICTRVAYAESLSARFPTATGREYVQIDVTDTGAGMDEQTRNRIFEPFFTTKEPGKGTGLGLAVVFGIVESHKGLIDVESELGKGTTFRVFLPVPEQSLETATSKEEKAEEIRGGSETILFVEDEEMLRDLMKVILVSKGYKVLTAGDGEEAIDIYSRHQADIAVVLTDFGLPKFSGEEVFKKLKAINPKAHVVITSGYIDPVVKSEMYKAGVKHFLQKPYQPDEILKRIREVIEGRRIGK